jgi:hypothetical protein
MRHFLTDFIQHRFEKRSIAGLAKALHHRSDLARREAAEALAELGDPRAVPLLMAAYADPKAERAAIIQALGRLRDETAADFLAGIYHQGPAGRYGQLAVQNLRAIGGPRADEESRIAYAIDDVKSEDPGRRAKGIAELRLLGPAAARVLVAELEEWAKVRSHPDLSMAEAIEEALEIAGIKRSLEAALLEAGLLATGGTDAERATEDPSR